jgi:hypothetical protein
MSARSIALPAATPAAEHASIAATRHEPMKLEERLLVAVSVGG